MEFSAVKNSTGSESPATAKADLLRTYADWLEAAGFHIPRDKERIPEFAIEISPLFARNAEELKLKKHLIMQIDDGMYLE